MGAVSKRLLVAAAAAVVVLVGTGAGSCRPAEPNQQQQPDAQGRETARPARPSSERHNDLEVADGVRPRAIDFVDATTGYALFTGCTNNTCGGALFVTFDGGFSWVERKLPTDRFDSPEKLAMQVVDSKTVVLTVLGPDAWYRSTDTGRTFTQGEGGVPKPSDVLRGVGAACVSGGGTCPAAVLVDGVPTPAQPTFPVGLRSAAGAPGGPIWAVAADLTTVYTARSDDGGQTWHQAGTPLTVPGTNVLQVSASLDHLDVWLLASGGPGASAAYYMHEEGWHEVNRDVRVSLGIDGGAAAGSGVLAVPGERFGFVFADGQWSEAARPSSVRLARMLSDGTLLALAGPGDAWLGTGSGAARLWSRVTVDPV
jgi:hypothetical protein